MSDTFSQFTGDIPTHYDEGLGPHIFVDFAADNARRTAALQPGRVLELAAGTGIVSRALADTLPSSTQLTVTDLNPPMLAVAAAKLAGAPNVVCQPADAMDLPFEEGSFDTVVSQFGVMFFPDKTASHRQVHRVLTSGGRYLFNLWDPMESNPFSQIAHECIGAFFDNDPPQFYTVPFGYNDIARITRHLIDAGFESVQIETVRIENDRVNPGLFARGLVQGNPTIVEIRTRLEVSPEEIQAAVAEKLRRDFGDPGRMPLQAIFVSARKP